MAGLSDVTTVEEFIGLLDELRLSAGLSFRDLEARAKERGDWLPRTTANDAVKRRCLPHQQNPMTFIAAWAGACGTDADEWCATWSHLATATSDAPRKLHIPHQLPASIAGFSGREPEMEALDEILVQSLRHPSAPVIVVISGTPGVGKTALAVEWAHRRADRFPDGQLYLDLRGFSQDPPLEPKQSLSALLHAFGVSDAEIPLAVTAQTGLYRSLLSGRRLLIVLDNASDVQQIRPLLPGTPTCVVLVTSRHGLPGLVAREGACTVKVGRMGDEAARDLVIQAIGAPRGLAEPAALDELVRLCAHLPLALRISGANLATSPFLSLADYIALMSEGDDLAAFQAEGDPETGVRTAFDMSYARLSAPAQKMFRRLGLVPVTDICVSAAAALAGTTNQAARQVLDTLACAHLLDPLPGGRFAAHDLMHAYAKQLALAEDTETERVDAVDRLLNWYLAHAQGASKTIMPSIMHGSSPRPDVASVRYGSNDTAFAWLQDERVNLVALVKHTALQGPRPLAWYLSDLLRSAYYSVFPRHDLLILAEAAIEAASREENLLAEAIAHHSLASAVWPTAQYGLCLEHSQQACSLARQGGFPLPEAAALITMSTAKYEMGDLSEAEALLRQGLAVIGPDGPRRARVNPLIKLSQILCDTGNHKEAMVCATSANKMAEQVGDPRWQAMAASALGTVYEHLKDTATAHRHYSRAVEIASTSAIRIGEGLISALLGIAKLEPDQEAAFQTASQALATSRHCNYRFLEGQALTTVARILLKAGRLDEACVHVQKAVTLHHHHGQQLAEDVARALLAEIDQSVSQPDGAGGEERDDRRAQ
ncbi:NB-ARC domain-containing protein [Nonomuraea solani]|uniref:NB-ARC domain-containing protein n=1 Tax=Nonomuraea solani TaxID=1144553 RepID=A0A1H6F298_9ACTN|nr:NB-ARC domain-containing protein [Nonomuraea solani]SEH03501.1 NB-ARC domain-containing protein [Nonomuraea solani]